MNFFQLNNVKGLLIAGTILFGAAACSDYDDQIANLGDRITNAEESIADLQSQIDAGGLVSKVEKTASGFDIYFTGGNTDKISLTNGENGKDGINGTNGQDGEDGKDGINGTNGTNGQDGEDGKDGINGTNGQDGEDGKDGKDGVDGKDVTSSSITYRNEGDYALFFFDAVGDEAPRVIYAPMDVETPSSVTVLTSTLKDLTVGGNKSFDVVVNPTANAKAIKEFCLVSEAAYTRSESVYGAAPEGLEIVDAEPVKHATIPGRYTITVKCSSISALANAIFIAAKYEVNTFEANGIGLDGSIAADAYEKLKADKTLYNVAEECELLSSTPITGSAEYESLEAADITVKDVVLYPETSASFDILASADDLINVDEVVTSVYVAPAYGAETDIEFEYADGKLTVTSALESASVVNKTYYSVRLRVFDFNGNMLSKSFRVTVYPDSAITANTNQTINAWLPTVNDYVTKTSEVDFNGLLNYNFEYDFTETTLSASFGDIYDLEGLGADVKDGDDVTAFVSYEYDEATMKATYKLTANGSTPLQPGLYTIEIIGSATPKVIDSPYQNEIVNETSEVDAKLVQVVMVEAPRYKISLNDATALNAAEGTYQVNTWENIAVKGGLINPAISSQVADAPYLYTYNESTAEGDNVITDEDGIRVLVNGKKTGEIAFTDSKFAAGADIAATEFEKTLRFYCLLSTGVMFPIELEQLMQPEFDNAATTLVVNYSKIDLTSVAAAYQAGSNLIDYSDAVNANSSFEPTAVSAFEQNNVLYQTTDALQPMVNGAKYSTYVTYSYERIDGAKYYKDGYVAGATAEELPEGSAFKNIINVNAAGEVSIAVPNLNWQASPNATYSQKIKVTATDFFGQSVETEVEIFVEQ